MSLAPKLQGRSILVVEDDYLIALTVVEMLQDMGAEVLGPIGFLEEALTYAAAHDTAFDSAVVDVDLHGSKSYPLIDLLSQQGKHIVLSSGYGSDALHADYHHLNRCEKPYAEHQLIAALGK